MTKFTRAQTLKVLAYVKVHLFEEARRRMGQDREVGGGWEWSISAVTLRVVLCGDSDVCGCGCGIDEWNVVAWTTLASGGSHK